jgi:hypothetical protein
MNTCTHMPLCTFQSVYTCHVCIHTTIHACIYIHTYTQTPSHSLSHKHTHKTKSTLQSTHILMYSLILEQTHTRGHQAASVGNSQARATTGNTSKAAAPQVCLRAHTHMHTYLCTYGPSHQSIHGQQAHMCAYTLTHMQTYMYTYSRTLLYTPTTDIA